MVASRPARVRICRSTLAGSLVTGFDEAGPPAAPDGFEPQLVGSCSTY
jgi:hypothetical protein